MKKKSSFKNKKLSLGNRLATITLLIGIYLLVSCQNEKPEPPKLPTLTTTAISNITSSSASGGGNISNDGGAAITARGIVWSTNPTPTIALTTKTADGTGVGSFTSNLIGLLPATIYYVRAYASNSAGTAYSGEFSFTSVSDITITTTPSFLGLNSFYQKYLNAFGLPVVSSNKVPDAAVLQAKRIVDQMLAKIPNSALEKMVQNKMLVAIMAKDEVTTDIPEHSDLNRVFPATDWNKRARGLGATIQRPATSCAEENLLCYPTDGYSGEDILIHEFAHTIHLIGLNLAFPTFDNELKNIYNEAIAKGLWTNTYAASNYVEYFAEGVQDWFNVNKEAIPTNGIHNNINTREELKTYDPKLYELISRYFNEDSKKVSCQIGK